MSLGKMCFAQKFYLFAGIMLNAFAILLCSKLCWHDWLKQTDDFSVDDHLLRIDEFNKWEWQSITSFVDHVLKINVGQKHEEIQWRVADLQELLLLNYCI